MKRIISILFTLTFCFPPFLLGQSDFITTHDGVKLRYIESGQGAPVILIHGFTGSSVSWTDNGVFQSLAEDFHVIAFDARGHGQSDKPHNPEMYGANMALDTLALMDHFDYEKAHVVGYSMGARLTGYLLGFQPHRLLTATFGASPPRLDYDKNREANELRAQNMIRRLSEQSDGETGRPGQDFEALKAILHSWESQAITSNQIKDNEINTLAIVGSEDERLEGMQNFSKAMPNTQLKIVEGATHSGEEGLGFRPEFINTIKDFLQRN